jgi:hypothetical protein
MQDAFAEKTPRENEGECSQQGVIRITVNLVQGEAVVTDSKGHQVTNLRPEDFEVLEDGRPQTITNFSYISVAGLETSRPPSARPPGTPRGHRFTVNLVRITQWLSDGSCT